jgi:GT2 family glycosyltransferase
VDLEVLICTHDRAALLARAIASLNAADRPAGVEVGLFVAANACTDGTLDWLREYQRGASARGLLPLRWIEVATPGKSVALNAALPLVDAPLTAFVDDDHRVDPGYLAGVARAARGYPEVSLFCGRILPDWDGREPGWVHDQGPYRIYPLPVPRFDQGDAPRLIALGTVTPGGGDLFIRTALFERVGPFALELGPVGHNLGGAEDIEWVRRALRLGEALQYVPDVVQYHYVDNERLRLGYLLRKAYERTSATMRVSGDVAATDRLPPYMLRKVLEYGVPALFSLSPDRRRHFLVRVAAALGEVRGFLHRRADLRRGVRRP